MICSTCIISAKWYSAHDAVILRKSPIAAQQEAYTARNTAGSWFFSSIGWQASRKRSKFKRTNQRTWHLGRWVTCKISRYGEQYVWNTLPVFYQIVQPTLYSSLSCSKVFFTRTDIFPSQNQKKTKKNLTTFLIKAKSYMRSAQKNLQEEENRF